MAGFISNQQPEVILSTVCGPGVSMHTMALPVYLYIVYTFPAYVYTGFPECIPKADSSKVTKAIEDKAIPPSFRNHFAKMFLVRDDDFLKSIWRGSIWPIAGLFSPVKEPFTEAGNYLLQQKDRFLTKEAVSGWLSADVGQPDPTMALDSSIAWSMAEAALSKKFGSAIPLDVGASIVRRNEDDEFAADERVRLENLVQLKKDVLPDKMKKDDLNDILVTIRGLS